MDYHGLSCHGMTNFTYWLRTFSLSFRQTLVLVKLLLRLKINLVYSVVRCKCESQKFCHRMQYSVVCIILCHNVSVAVKPLIHLHWRIFPSCHHVIFSVTFGSWQRPHTVARQTVSVVCGCGGFWTFNCFDWSSQVINGCN